MFALFLMAITFYDVAYGLGLAIAAPWWLLRPSTRRKLLAAFRERMGRSPAAPDSRPAVFIHAVSNGELNATTSLLRLLAERRPDIRFVVSTTTASGWDRSSELYGNDPRVTRIRYPLDFSHAVSRVLDSAKPAVVVLMELELWPNFVGECRRRRIPVILANGRITETSFRGYRLVRPLVGGMFRNLAYVCAQEARYAERFLKLGAPANRISVVGTMKFDSAHLGDRVEGSEQLAADVGIAPADGPVWVCGSTGPGEEELILDAYRALIDRHPTLRLVIVPRHRPRFDEVAELIAARGFAIKRRSHVAAPSPSSSNPNRPVILGDTFGELRKFYSLATVVLVGRTLVDLGPRQHGSDMIEPAALGKPVVVGPFTQNFAEPMNCFLAADAIRVVGVHGKVGGRVSSPSPSTSGEASGIGDCPRAGRGEGRPDRASKTLTPGPLPEYRERGELFGPPNRSRSRVVEANELVVAIDSLLIDLSAAVAIGARAKEVVRQQQGATEKHVQIILDQLNREGDPAR